VDLWKKSGHFDHGSPANATAPVNTMPITTANITFAIFFITTSIHSPFVWFYCEACEEVSQLPVFIPRPGWVLFLSRFKSSISSHGESLPVVFLAVID
jgi:hypothetical protein